MQYCVIYTFVMLLMRYILQSQSHCVGSLSFSKNYLSRKANFTSLTCKDRQKGSAICVAKRNLASEYSEFIDFRCPPEDKDIVQCDLAVSRSNPFACQYYHYRHFLHSTPSLIQHCCCHKQACMEPITRVEYRQRHLRRVTINLETVFLFWLTIVINIMTVMVFFDQIVAFFVDAYDRNWGCHISQKMLTRRNINQLQTDVALM
uniref:Uncharacterized protein n=1 Tax=Parascaris univalens TaxID=6257 RepID=A0A915BV07_PARUN